MKKQFIQLGVVAVLLVGAIAAFLLLRREEPVEDESPADDTVYVLGGIPQPFVKELTVQNPDDTYTIVNGFENAIQQSNSSESRYTVEGLDTDTLNQTQIQSVMTAAANLPAKKVVAESGANLADYGLDQPVVTLTATYDSGEKTLLVGDEAPGDGGTYVAVDGAVYTVSTTTVNVLRGDRLSLVNRAVTPGNSGATVLERATLKGRKYAEPIEIGRIGDTEQSAMSGLSSYRITAPIQSDADSQNAIPALQTIFGLSADRVVAVAEFQDETAANYGLDDPYLHLDVLPANDEENPENNILPFSVVFSEPDGEGNVYLQVSTGRYVYQIAQTSLAFYGLELFDYQSKMIVLPYIDSVSEVEVQDGDAIYLFELSGEGDDLKVKLGGQELDTANFRQFYQTLVAARYDSEIGGSAGSGSSAPSVSGDVSQVENLDEILAVLPDSLKTSSDAEAATEPERSAPDEESAEPVEPESETSAEETAEPESENDTDPSTGTLEADHLAGQPLLQITYRYRDGSPEDVVRFSPGPTLRAIVSHNGGQAYYALRSYVDRVLEDLDKVARGEEVKSYL